MADSLTVTSGSGGDQTPTSNSSLQAPSDNGTNSAQAKDFQPGIAGDSLKSSSGISLNPTALSTVDLSGASSGAAVAAAAPVQPRHFNPILIGGVVVLFAAAAIMFYMTSQSGKKYNQY